MMADKSLYPVLAVCGAAHTAGKGVDVCHVYVSVGGGCYAVVYEMFLWLPFVFPGITYFVTYLSFLC